MKLAVDVTAAPDRLAGAGHYMVSLVGALDRTTEIELEVFAREVHHAELARVAPGARIHRAAIDARPVRLLWEQTVFPLRLRRLRPDVVHSPHYTMPRASPAPVVVTFHDATFFTHPELHEAVKVRFFRRAIRTAARRASRIVAVSHATRRAILEHTDAAADRVDVVYEGVDPTELFPPGEEELSDFRVRHGIERPWIAFLGTLEPRKNLPRLIDAFSAVAGEWDGDLLLAGRPGWGMGRLDAALARAPRGRVRRLGYVDDVERRSYLGGAALVCYPSIAEGFGLPVIEAMACGAPVLTSRGSSTEEVAGDAAELADPLDVESLAAGLRRALEPQRADHLRCAGAAQAGRFSWDTTADQMSAVYRRALT